MRVVTQSDRPGQSRQARIRRGRSEGAADGAARVEGEKRTPFTEILAEVLPPLDSANEDLHQLWSDLPQAERDILETPSAQHFAAYRELVRRIAAATLRRNARVRTMVRRGTRGTELKLSVVEFIDERLQKMAVMMHSPRNSAFALLRAFEEIRGLLLDVKE